MKLDSVMPDRDQRTIVAKLEILVRLRRPADARAKPDGYTIGSGQVGGGMPEEFDKLIQDERAKWAEVIKEVNISFEE